MSIGLNNLIGANDIVENNLIYQTINLIAILLSHPFFNIDTTYMFWRGCLATYKWHELVMFECWIRRNWTSEHHNDLRYPKMHPSVDIQSYNCQVDSYSSILRGGLRYDHMQNCSNLVNSPTFLFFHSIHNQAMYK